MIAQSVVTEGLDGFLTHEREEQASVEVVGIACGARGSRAWRRSIVGGARQQGNKTPLGQDRQAV